MRVCLDLDGTICYNKQINQKYEDVLPIEGAVEKIRQWKKDGHEIIIYTARNMATCNNSLGKIIKNQSSIITDWLNYYGIPFDELWFGKPLADIYIDDKALKFENWNINL